MTRFAPKYVRTLLVCALMLFAVSVHTAEATHFLGGKITWVRDFTHPNPTEAKVIITFEASWRASFGWVPFPNIPGTVITDPLYQINLTTAQNLNTALSMQQQVISYNAQDDWFLGRYTFAVIYPLTAFPLKVHHTQCCRASTLKEANNDQTWILDTLIDLSKGTRSPDSTLLPRITLQQNVLNQFQLPTVAYDGYTNRVALAPAGTAFGASGLITVRPVGSPLCTGSCSVCTNLPSSPTFCAAALTVTNAGLVSWQPQVAGLYAVQFTITSYDDLNVAKNSTPLDLLIEVETPCNPADAGCNTPPTVAAAPSVNATAGKPLSLNVSANDLQTSQVVTIASSALPSGATFTAQSPVPTYHPTYFLNWTPTNAQAGDYNVCFQAYDNAGGTSVGQVCTTIHVVQSPPPQLVCNPVPALERDHNGAIGVALSGATFDPDGTAVAVLLKNGAATIGSATIPAGTLSLAPFSAAGNFPQGTTTVTVTATDTVGSSSTCNIVVTVSRQSQSITFTGQDPVAYALNAHVAFNGAATSGLPVSYFVVSGPGAIVGGQLELHGVGVIEVRSSQPGNPDFAPATDVNAFFHVVDVTAPAIAPHASETAEATSTAGAAVNYTSPSFTDDVDPSGTANCSPASGSTFPIGSTQVTCHAQDAAGNASDTQFAVNVTDTTAPTIGTNPNISTPSTSPAGATVTFGVPSASDLADAAPIVTCAPASGSTFPQGTTQVTCTATDAHGNHASSIFTVSVTNSAPAVSVPANITAEATSAAGAAVPFAATADDNEQGAITPTCVPAAGQFPLGTTTVTCTATDVANATGSASFTVTVQDTTAPAVTYSGNAGSYTIGQTINITCSATDAVGVATSTCVNISGPGYSFAASNSYSATATDAAGNTGSGSTSFTVVTTLQGLQDLVNSFCNNPGVCQGLNAKLTAAANAPNANARRGQLGAFENQVAAQTGKCMTAEQAAILLQLVRAFFN